MQKEKIVYGNIYTGNDETGDGTKDKPFKTIKKALQSADLMSTNIIVKPGTAEGLFVIEKPSEKITRFAVEEIDISPAKIGTLSVAGIRPKILRDLVEIKSIVPVKPQSIVTTLLQVLPPPLKVEEEIKEQLSDEVKSLLRTVKFTIPEESPVTFTIYDVMGKAVRAISPKVYPQGEITFTWDGKDDDGNVMDSSTYIVVMQAGDKKEVKRITHIK